MQALPPHLRAELDARFPAWFGGEEVDSHDLVTLEMLRNAYADLLSLAHAVVVTWNDGRLGAGPQPFLGNMERHVREAGYPCSSREIRAAHAAARREEGPTDAPAS